MTFTGRISQFVCIIAGVGAFKLIETIKFENKSVKNSEDIQ